MEKLREKNIFSYVFLMLQSLLITYLELSVLKMNMDFDNFVKNYEIVGKYEGMVLILLLVMLISVLYYRSQNKLVLYSKAMPALYIFVIPILLLGLIVTFKLSLNISLFLTIIVIFQLFGLYRYVKVGDKRYPKNISSEFRLLKNSFVLELFMIAIFYLTIYFLTIRKPIGFILIIFLVAGGLIRNKLEIKTKLDDILEDNSAKKVAFNVILVFLLNFTISGLISFKIFSYIYGGAFLLYLYLRFRKK